MAKGNRLMVKRLNFVYKKAEGLSLSVVVIAAICLLVLVVLSVIFAVKMGMFDSGLRHCDTECVGAEQICRDKGYTGLPVYVDGCTAKTVAINGPAYCCKGEIVKK